MIYNTNDVMMHFTRSFVDLQGLLAAVFSDYVLSALLKVGGRDGGVQRVYVSGITLQPCSLYSWRQR